MTPRKDLESLRTKAVRQGFKVEKTRNNHYRWSNSKGNFFISASTPSDVRAIVSLKGDLRRLGFLDDYVKPKKEIIHVEQKAKQSHMPDIESVQCSVSGCGKRFLKEKYKDHLEQVHSVFYCSECDRKFMARHHYGRHMSSIHKVDSDGNALFDCPFGGCTKSVSSGARAITSHFKVVHGVDYVKWANGELKEEPKKEEPKKEEPKKEEPKKEEPKKDTSLSERTPGFDFAPLMKHLLEAAPYIDDAKWELLTEFVKTSTTVSNLLK